ncbi:hypothetical protein [Streptomyces sp. NPDC058751]|uniref:hypothetical protein n=1 Tax=Streptomyces sp. NPDC058751 TaxID=3346623 RepID=UPI0036CE88E7
MIATSVVWAAAVFAFGLGDEKPDTRGYRLGKDACRSVRLASLGADIASRESTSMINSGFLKHPALDQVQCLMALRPDKQPSSGWITDYTVGIKMALYKKNDPGAEFEAQSRVTALGVVPKENLQRVADLGDKAYLITQDISTVELRVLDGGAVFSLSLSAVSSYPEEFDGKAGEEVAPDVPDVSPRKRAMIDDMRDLMSGLKL